MRPIEVIQGRLDDVRGARARCPACDKRGALSFREGDDGTVLVRCFRGCTAAEITAALGLDMRSLFVAKTTYELRDEAEAQDREREAYRRNPDAYKRAAVRREIDRIQRDRRTRLGFRAPLRSAEVDLARRNVLKRLLGYGV